MCTFIDSREKSCSWAGQTTRGERTRGRKVRITYLATTCTYSIVHMCSTCCHGDVYRLLEEEYEARVEEEAAILTSRYHHPPYRPRTSYNWYY